MVGFEGCRGSRLGGCANGRSARQADGQAGTRVAEIVGSAQDACSGSSRVIRFRGRRGGGGGMEVPTLTGAAVSRGRQATRCVARASTQLSLLLARFEAGASSRLPCPATADAYLTLSHACGRDGRMITVTRSGLRY